MKGALDVHRTLLASGVPHEVVHLRSRVLTADDLPRVLGVERGCVAARCYAVEGGSDPDLVVVLVPAGATVSPDALQGALGNRSAQAAGDEQINAMTDYAAGLVSPVCLPATVEVLADRALREEDVLYCAVGEGSVALAIHSSDLLQVTGARVLPLAVSRSAPVAQVRSSSRDRLSPVRSTG